MNGNNSELYQKLFGGNEPPKKKIPAFFIISAALLLVAIILLSVFLFRYCALSDTFLCFLSVLPS